jgi:hypothetical protein
VLDYMKKVCRKKYVEKGIDYFVEWCRKGWTIPGKYVRIIAGYMGNIKEKGWTNCSLFRGRLDWKRRENDYLKNASVDGLNYLRNASEDGLDYLRNASVDGLDYLRNASVDGLDYLRNASVDGLDYTRNASVDGLDHLRNASVDTTGTAT